MQNETGAKEVSQSQRKKSNFTLNAIKYVRGNATGNDNGINGWLGKWLREKMNPK